MEKIKIEKLFVPVALKGARARASDEMGIVRAPGRPLVFWRVGAPLGVGALEWRKSEVIDRVPAVLRVPVVLRDSYRVIIVLRKFFAAFPGTEDRIGSAVRRHAAAIEFEIPLSLHV